jgi:hypothetical protein
VSVQHRPPSHPVRRQVEAGARSQAAAGYRAYVENLLATVEGSVTLLEHFDYLPLDLVSRFERALTRAHIRNLLRVSTIAEVDLLQPEKEGM